MGNCLRFRFAIISFEHFYRLPHKQQWQQQLTLLTLQHEGREKRWEKEPKGGIGQQATGQEF